MHSFELIRKEFAIGSHRATLSYDLLFGSCNLFGIAVRMTPPGERVEFPHLCSSIEKATRAIFKLAAGNVTPIAVQDVLDDMRCLDLL